MQHDGPPQDPLAALAAELEKLSQASLRLGEATAALCDVAGEDADLLRAAAEESKRTARTAAAASARVADADDPLFAP